MLIFSKPAFLTTLRSNLHLSASDPSPYSSLVSTPTSAAFSTALLAHPTPSPLSISTTAPTTYNAPKPEPEPLPLLATSIARQEHVDDRNAALRLIADSVSEQRLANAKAAVLHPASLAVIVLATLLLANCCSLPLLFAVVTGMTFFGLTTLYWITMEFGTLSHQINWDWLDGGRKSGHGKGEDPIVVVSRWGEEIIAAMVLRVVKRERKGYVKAWTVESSYRGNGVGMALLDEGVRVAWGKGARCVVFEGEHASEYLCITWLLVKADDVISVQIHAAYSHQSLIVLLTIRRLGGRRCWLTWLLILRERRAVDDDLRLIPYAIQWMADVRSNGRLVLKCTSSFAHFTPEQYSLLLDKANHTRISLENLPKFSIPPYNPYQCYHLIPLVEMSSHRQ